MTVQSMVLLSPSVPTVQNPTGTVMSETRRRELLHLAAAFGVPILEDDCYADLLFEGGRPPAIRALDQAGLVIYCGSFSKSLAPAIRIGYLVADWPVMSRMLACKADAGSGALEQMALAEAYSPRSMAVTPNGKFRLPSDQPSSMTDIGPARAMVTSTWLSGGLGDAGGRDQ